MPTHRLWTPIANALEAYRRRVVTEPEAEYEHIWRLVHIQEALAVSLASLMATRLAQLLVYGPNGDTMNEIREALTGLRRDAVSSDNDDDVESSPWGGSLGEWIELLKRFGKTAMVAEDPFLAALAGYLSSAPNRPLAFADTWARIAPVPATFREPRLDRVGRLGAINSFRNKFAHVPVSQRLLGDLHRGLRVEVLDGLTDKFNPETDTLSPGFAATSYREPLVGVLFRGSTYVTGASEVGIERNGKRLGSRITACYGKASTTVEWPVEPFFRIDGEAKTALLFRVTDLRRGQGAMGYGGEYHRFAAELEPVTYVTIPAEAIAQWIPRLPTPATDVVLSVLAGAASTAEAIAGPGKVDQPDARQEQSTSGAELLPRELRRNAEEAFTRRDYGSAVALFDALAESGDLFNYNDVARSKHGAALWRAAEQSAFGDGLQQSLARAVALLRQAERHRDSRHAARSAYEGSKASWHLWRATRDGKHLLDALDAAERAVAGSPNEAFISWQARVKSDADVTYPQGIPEVRGTRTQLDGDPNQSVRTRADEFYRMSIAQGKRGKYKEAAAAAQEAVQLCPLHTNAWRSLATNLSQMGQHQEARDAWQAHDKLSENAVIDFKSAAYSALISARTNWVSASAWDRVAKVFDTDGRGAEAITEGLRVLESHPEAHASLLPIVERLVNPLPELVGELIEVMRGIDPTNTYYIHLHGVAKRKAGLSGQAFDDFRMACELAPLNASYWYALGRCLEDARRFRAACNAFEKAVACSSPPHLKAQQHLRDIREGGRLDDEARESAQVAAPHAN